MRVYRRQFMMAGSAGLLSCHSWAAPVRTTTPEAFGAKGDGRTNDTDAFAAMSAYVSAQGGGTIVLRPVTYIVGKQTRSVLRAKEFAFAPATIMHFVGCQGSVAIVGNGATLRCMAGLRFGTFEPQSGRPTMNKSPNYKREERAAPYRAMIRIERCSGPVTITDLELDGNVRDLTIGGKYGDAGWQIACHGIELINNSGPERLSRINSHHHPMDGVYIRGPADRLSFSVLSDIRCDYNGRQGCSITGGRNYTFVRCLFRHTGKGGIRSLPSAGVDIEAEKRPIRRLTFSACEFSDNAGPGVLGAGGDAEGATFEGCTIIGTTSWAMWPDKPGFRFSSCLLVGAIIHAYGDPDPTRATQFRDCKFRDDPELSPSGQVFTGRGTGRAIAWLPNHENVLFNRCDFALTHGAVLPMSTKLVLYSDCDMAQASRQRSRPQGTYFGSNRITGNVDLRGSVIRGTLILNGRALAAADLQG